MEDWQKRVYDEKKNLDIKLNKLTIFINQNAGKGTVDDIDYNLLLKQQKAMREYSDTLDERIARFK